jgi:hypothetical protein
MFSGRHILHTFSHILVTPWLSRDYDLNGTVIGCHLFKNSGVAPGSGFFTVEATAAMVVAGYSVISTNQLTAFADRML